jgi:hypothetical protein
MRESHLLRLVRGNPINRVLLERLPQSGLTDCWLVSGAVFQTVWNALTGRPPQYGIKDYDIFYFDTDTSWEGEDRAIRRCRSLFADLDAEIEVRNQARVHLWYAEKFGARYPRLSCATDGIEQFLTGPSTQIGISPSVDGLRFYGTAGLSELEAMVVRPNPTSHFQAERYRDKTTRWKRCWPELSVVEDFPATAAAG